MNDMIAFFCEDKADMNELLQVLREEKRLAINVAHSPPSQEPLSVEYQPRMAISDLRYFFISLLLYLSSLNFSYGFLFLRYLKFDV